jgi:hypothetical protein
MPVDIAFLHGGIGALISCSGDVTAQEFIDADNQLLAVPKQFAECRFVIVEFTSISSFNVSASEVRRFVDLDIRMAAIQPRLVVAVVAPTDVTFGMSRMWQVMAEVTGWEIMVFRTRQKGEDWVRQKSEMPDLQL